MRSLFISVLLLTFNSLCAQIKSYDSLNQAIHNAGKDNKLLSPLQLQLGIAYFNDGSFDSALLFLNQAVTNAKEIKDNATHIQALNNIGNVYADKGNNTEALKYYQQALPLAEGINNKNYVGEIQKNIGALYLSWKRFDEALSFYRLAKQTAIENHNQLLEADCNNNIGTVYEQQLKYPEALAVYRNALDYYTASDNKSRMAMALSNVAIVYKFLQKYPLAIEYNMKGLALAQQRKSQWTEAAILNNIGSIYGISGQYDSAIFYCNKSIDLSRKMDAIEIVYNSYETMADAASKAGDYKSSVEYYKKYVASKDSFLNAETNRQLSELQTKYNTEKKDKQIAAQSFELTKRNFLLWIIATIAVLGSLLAYNYYKRSTLRKEKQLQLEVLKQQDLAVKAVLQAEENERKRIAAELHDGVGQIMSAARMNLSAFEHDLQLTDSHQKLKFEKIISLVDDSCREVRVVSHNMMPNALIKSGLGNAVRDFVDKIDSRVLKVDLYCEGLNERLDASIETVLYRVIQECVNNVIKHSGANHLDISLTREAGAISVTIEDNGKGFDNSRQENFEGIGLKNMLTRIKYLKGDIEFNSAPGKGTFVGIHVPLSQ
ncbi:MAG: sensor histidine kinase [Bacteroidota bacterium]